MPCYSYLNEDFKEHAIKTHECMAGDLRVDTIVKRLALINGWQKFEKLIKGTVLIAGALHDIGKGTTKHQSGNLKRFQCHDFIGSTIMYFITQNVNKELGLPEDMAIFIRKVLMGLPLLHHYLHRDWDTGERCRKDIKDIINGNIDLSSDCVATVHEVLNSITSKEKGVAQLVNVLVKSLTSVKTIDKYYVNYALALYGAFSMDKDSCKYGNDPDIKKLCDREFVEKYNWFFETATAVLNECDVEAAKSRKDC